MTSIFIVKKY